jgi:hypothetical protein
VGDSDCFPLRPFGLVLHHDGRWTHEGHPILHHKIREVFDRSVRFLPDEGEAGKYVVQIGRFRGEIEVEEAGFFVREFDAEAGRVRLSDGTSEPLEASSLRLSGRDGALLCLVKRDLAPEGLPARFHHTAQSDLLLAIDETPDGMVLRMAGRGHPLPAL